MPFQLDTSIYSGGGAAAPRQRQSSLGMLGELMDFQARQENLAGLQEQRGYINEQRQGQIAKQQREAAIEAALQKLGPNATFEELAPHIGAVAAEKAIDDREKGIHARRTERLKGAATWAQKALALTDPLEQARVWDEGQQEMIRDKWIQPEHVTPWSAEVGQSVIDASLSQPEYVSARTARANAKTAADAEARLLAKAKIDEVGDKADAAMKARVQFVPHLQAAKTKEDYKHIYDQYPKEYVGVIPTADDVFGKNAAAAREKLNRFSLTPAEYEANRDRDADRAQRAAQFAAEQKRLAAQAGVTPARRDAALGRRNNDIQALQLEKARRLDQGTPMTELEELQRTTQIEQFFRAETHEPPDLKLAEQLKDASIKDLEARITKRSKDSVDTQGNKIPARPMSDAAIKAEKLSIVNRYRADHGLGPVTKLGPEWGYDGDTPKDTPQDGTLGALANTTPPKVQPPARRQPAGAPAPGPAVDPVAALAQVQGEIDALKARTGGRPTAAQSREYEALRARKAALLAQGR